jgi:hypothetical protein
MLFVFLLLVALYISSTLCLGEFVLFSLDYGKLFAFSTNETVCPYNATLDFGTCLYFNHSRNRFRTDLVYFNTPKGFAAIGPRASCPYFYPGTYAVNLTAQSPPGTFLYAAACCRDEYAFLCCQDFLCNGVPVLVILALCLPVLGYAVATCVLKVKYGVDLWPIGPCCCGRKEEGTEPTPETEVSTY